MKESRKAGVRPHWRICTVAYEVDGVSVPEGRMIYCVSTWPSVSKKWRRATQEEIDGMQYYKGNPFYLTI